MIHFYTIGQNVTTNYINVYKCFMYVNAAQRSQNVKLQKDLYMIDNSTPPASMSLHAGKMQAATNPQYSTPNNFRAYA